ncbi:MAG TPA: hypothetical protein PKD09_19325 [Aggregatilinea sp.]|uniref:hypothetical protein n=1 Tax=Aggregatilinea sp. TaxID=2806333 RepID=UPI002B6DE969|nr:hypothetical protein [Aggregatilinea sp.]HML23816.1 hypothetical protein [Aggregatilinea sp.]
MNRKQRFTFASGLLITALAAITILGLAIPAGAAPSAQDIPTPTPYPAENTPYTLDVVGGQDATLTFPAVEQEGFRLGETTALSNYPRGMEFRVTAESDGGPIQDVILFVTLVHGTGNRAVAEWDAEAQEWVARIWETGNMQPAWTPISVHWRVRDAAENSIDTEPQPVEYADTGREWFRMESEHVVLYWTGFGEDDPDTVAQTMADAMAATHPRRVAGFGRALSYKPVAVVYPDRETLAETVGSGAVSDRFAGITSTEWGMSIQVLRGTDYAPGNENCVWATKPEDWTMERRINTIYSVTTHEVTHLYQFDVLGGSLGPQWWSEGQADWFSLAPGNYDERLRALEPLQDMPSLTGEIGWTRIEADGCYALAYDMGVSFINFLLTNYGGIETHLKIAEQMRLGTSVYAAVEDVTGKPFLDVENEWRTYLGYPALTLADIDPASALEPPLDTSIAEGDTLVLPSTPFMAPLYEEPGPYVLSNASCFAGTQVTVLRAGSLDGVDYYEVDCMGMTGWMSRDQLIGPES